MKFSTDQSFAVALDEAALNTKEQFIIPEKDGKQLIYFLGNSLGLQPKTANGYIQNIMSDWASLGVESFFHAKEPWMDYHEKFTDTLSKVVGAHKHEVVVMNQLTVNLHLMMVSFYNPIGKRQKIICEAKAFPSDQYTFETHLKHRGIDPEDAIIEVPPRQGEYTLRTEDILKTIADHGDEIALIFFSGVNYYTGQAFDMKAITMAGKKVNAKVGFDLAHAAGNIEMHLHDWDVDFACWCSYKYLNSGPGAIGGVFIHEKNHDKSIQRFGGWWGYDKASRFKMGQSFIPMDGAEGWQLSTPAFFLYAAHRAALEIIERVGWDKIIESRNQMTAYLWYMMDALKDKVTIVTPPGEEEHGCQISILMKENGKMIYQQLIESGCMVDWREPNVIRLAPVPLYNTYQEIWQFVNTLKALLQ